MLTWKELVEAEPEMAQQGRDLFYQFGVGLAFLGTVRKDGGPRVHPMCPVMVRNSLYALIVPGPKRHDLIRDGRYALHSFPGDQNEDAFYITGHAREIVDRDIRGTVVTTFIEERKGMLREEHVANQGLFEFLIDRALLTRTTGHGDPDPKHTIWSASD